MLIERWMSKLSLGMMLLGLLLGSAQAEVLARAGTLPMPQERIVEGSTTVTDVLFSSSDGLAMLTLNFMLDANGYITGQALADLEAQNPGTGGGSGVGYHEVWANRPDATVTHVSWPWFEGELAQWREEGIAPYMPIAEHDGIGWLPQVPSFGQWNISWYAGDPNNGGVLVSIETLEVVVTNASVQLQAMPTARIAAGNATIADVAFTEVDGEATLTLNYLVDTNGHITGQAADDLNNQIPAPGFDGVGYFEVWGDRPDGSVTHVRWPWFTGLLSDWRAEGIGPFIPVATDEGNGNWSPLVSSYGEWLVEWYVGDPNDGGLRVGAETLEVIVIDNSVLEANPQLTLDGPALLQTSEQGYYDVRLQNLGEAPVNENVEVQFAIARAGIQVGDVVVDYCIEPDAISGEACVDWAELPLTAVNGSLSGRFGPAEGFAIDASYDRTTFIRTAFAQPGNYDASAQAVGVDSSEVYTTAMTNVAITELSLSIEAGVPVGVPDSEAGWAYYTTTLDNLGDALPENVALWVSVDGIDDALKVSDNLEMEYFNGTSWENLGWAGQSSFNYGYLNRDAWFLGRPEVADGTIEGFPVGAMESFPTPVRVNFDNAMFDLTISVETADQTGEIYLYGLFEQQIGVISQAINLGLDVVRGVTAVDQPPLWDYFTATLSNTDGGATPDNILLFIEVAGTAYADGDALEFWNGVSWQTFGWDVDREAWFLGRDGAGGVSGFPIEAGEVFPIELRVNFLPDSYSFTVSVESVVDEIVGVGGVYATFNQSVDVLPSKASVTFNVADLVQTYDGSVKSVGVTTAPEANLDVAFTFDPAPPVNAGSYDVLATVVDDYYMGSAAATLVIEQAAQVIDFPALPDRIASDPPFYLGATSDSGLKVSFELISGPATVVGDEVTLTGAAGEVVIEAIQVGAPNWLPASVQQSFQVIAADAVRIEAISDIEITGMAGQPVDSADLPTVRVLDEFDNPVAGTIVAFEIATGSGSLTGTTHVSDEAGLATLGGWTLGGEGTQTVQAFAPGLSNSPMSFTAIVAPSADLRISIDDNRDTIEPGERNTYVVVITNSGPNAVKKVAVDVALAAELDAATAEWSCFPAGGANCQSEGSGGVIDMVNMPVDSSLVYILQADVLMESTQTIIMTATLTPPPGVSIVNEAELESTVATQIRVIKKGIFRDSFSESVSGVSRLSELDGPRAELAGIIELPARRSDLLPVERLISAVANADQVLFELTLVGAEGRTWMRASARGQDNSWKHSPWQPLAETEQWLAFDYAADSGLLLIGGEVFESTLILDERGQPVHRLSTSPKINVSIDD